MKQAVLIFLLVAWGILAPARIADTNLVSFPGGKCLMYRIYLQDKDLEHTPSRSTDLRSFSLHALSKDASDRSWQSTLPTCLWLLLM